MLNLPSNHWTNKEPGEILAELRAHAREKVINALVEVYANRLATQEAAYYRHHLTRLQAEITQAESELETINARLSELEAEWGPVREQQLGHGRVFELRRQGVEDSEMDDELKKFSGDFATITRLNREVDTLDQKLRVARHSKGIIEFDLEQLRLAYSRGQRLIETLEADITPDSSEFESLTTWLLNAAKGGHAPTK